MRIGVDVGGTNVDAVRLDDEGLITGGVRIPTRRGNRAVVGTIAEAVGALREDDRHISVGIGIPGLVDRSAGRVRHAVNLGIHDLPVCDAVAQLLEQRGTAPTVVTVENDVKAAALGACRLLGIDSSMGYLNLGTGLAAAVVLDGGVLHGHGGTAGEIGHISVDPQGARCGCGQRGCLETIASGGAIARAWGGATPADIHEVFTAGAARAVAVRDRFVDGVAAAIRLLVLTTGVATVVIGGGISRIGEELLSPVRDRLAEQAVESSFLADLQLPQRISLLPADVPAAAMGAALLTERSLARVAN